MKEASGKALGDRGTERNDKVDQAKSDMRQASEKVKAPIRK